MFAVWTVVLTVIMGCALGFLMDFIMSRTGLDLKSRKIVLSAFHQHPMAGYRSTCALGVPDSAACTRRGRACKTTSRP
jgi:hypothetical protein